MTLDQFHSTEKGVSAKPVFRSDQATVTSLQILRGELLREHVSKVRAWLLCVSGEVTYGSELGENLQLRAGEFQEIPPMIKHWVEGMQDSQLILVR